ncbi:ubiquitin carboxyl-terminal hydrolase MINDY-3 homolog [Schistocerca serialis cubense]|uniref:ubiquitin carboxyl-terminal hydrolase MINDY-3 homolog n=1 Tax=Schistocerca serialis cubense TaxID=2023355 RepID=UPI00214EABCF|nr:ubiquitin carboxyl-terminal hydrolase MINDY-3 homolog [Schistocerca serialis cubense]
MADFSGNQGNEINEIKRLLWGTIKDDVFRRWAQGFCFSSDEPTALVQNHGGPCAVIAPVQAFILRNIITEPVGNNWREVEQDTQNELLVGAICEILVQAARQNGGRFVLVDTCDSPTATPSPSTDSPTLDHSSVDYIEQPADESCCQKQFHAHLRVLTFENKEEVETFYLQRIYTLQGTYGVLLFLYSVIMTKGVEQIMAEVNDPAEPFIDDTYGYGSQSLINLMLTGRAVGNVWDHEQDVGGLKLLGIDRQSEIGFLAYLEHMRYLEVGSFLKNPKNPVWVLESETHLTVLFSFEKRLVSLETPGEIARRVFRKFDPEGNNFIMSSKLGELLKALDLVSDAEYVKVIMKKLDPENLGIILLNAFLAEFYPDEKTSVPDTFNLYHYNGLPGSCPDGKVCYQEGHAVLLECDIRCVLESNPMLTCLQTKWQNIEIQWQQGVTPSLN